MANKNNASIIFLFIVYEESINQMHASEIYFY